MRRVGIGIVLALLVAPAAWAFQVRTNTDNLSGCVLSEHKREVRRTVGVRRAVSMIACGSVNTDHFDREWMVALWDKRGRLLCVQAGLETTDGVIHWVDHRCGITEDLPL